MTARTPRRSTAPRAASTGKPLERRVALVAGATRGAGRGIAWALGEAGATVYCTGRSVAGAPSPYGRRETIDETAALVTEAGGHGVAVRVDHMDTRSVAALMARIARDHRRLDIVVCSLAGEDPSLAWQKPFGELSPDAALELLHHVVVTHLDTARQAIPLMSRGSLLVEVTEGDTLFMGGMSTIGTLAKTLQKVAAFVLGQKLKRHRIAVVAVTPGFLRSESMLDHFKVTEATWREGGRKDKHFLESETPRFVGRGVAAMAADPRVFRRSGSVTSSWALAREYGLVDADGRRPDWGAHMPAVSKEFKFVRDALSAEAAWLREIADRAERYLG
jgi:NAD(P)-dependent dehydrogenase (short-subunit alcohol dehydrogenase family)